METIEITFDYEYECGGHCYSKTISLPKEEFDEDDLLILVCSYMQTECGYPGEDVDEYLHNRFPDTHMLDDMSSGGMYNVYDCHVEGLKDFNHIADGLLGMTYLESEGYMKDRCRDFNCSKKGVARSNFSIWG